MKPGNSALPNAVALWDKLPDSAEVDVKSICLIKGLSKATIYRRVMAGRFPKPLPREEGTNATRWRLGDVRTA